MKTKKLLIFLVSLLTIFTLVGCSKSKIKTLEELKESYFKNQIGCAPFVEIQENKIENTEGEKLSDVYTETNFSSIGLIHKMVTNAIGEKVYTFYNIFTKNKFNITVPKENSYIQNLAESKNSIFVVNNNAKEIIFYSTEDGEKLLTLTWKNNFNNEIKFKYNHAWLNSHPVDLIRHTDLNSNISYNYYFYKKRLVTIDELPTNGYGINSQDELHLQVKDNYMWVYYKNKLYDILNFSFKGLMKFNVLENNNIVFQISKEVKLEEIGNDFDYIKSGGNTYILKSYFYDFNKKKLTELNLPYEIISVTANKKGLNGKYRYPDPSIKNVITLQFIDPISKTKENIDYRFVVDNYFKKFTFINTEFTYNYNESFKINDNLYITNVDKIYRLYDKKGKLLKVLDINWNILTIEKNRYLICNTAEDLEETPDSQNVVVYDLHQLNDKYEPKLISKELSVINEDFYSFDFLRNDKNEVFSLKDGKLNKLEGTLYLNCDEVLITKKDDTYYFYDQNGELKTELKNIKNVVRMFDSTIMLDPNEGVGYIRKIVFKYITNENETYNLIFTEVEKIIYK